MKETQLKVVQLKNKKWGTELDMNSLQQAASHYQQLPGTQAARIQARRAALLNSTM